MKITYAFNDRVVITLNTEKSANYLSRMLHFESLKHIWITKGLTQYSRIDGKELSELSVTPPIQE